MCTLGALVGAWPAHAADALQVMQSDAQGVTLRLDVPAPDLSAPGSDGRSRVSVAGLDPIGAEGRPSLPAAAALIALPPGAHATVRVMETGPEDARTGIKLVVGGKPGLRDDGGKFGAVQVIDPVAPIADGPWPQNAVELGAPFGMRRMRVVAVRVHPLRYDEASGTLWSRRWLTVRVDFQGADAAKLRRAASLPVEDRNWDAVLQQAVINFDVSRAWRAPIAPVTTPAMQLVRRSGAFAARPGAAEVPGFDEDNPEVRCVIDTTGLFALSYANLSAKGFPAGIADSLISVHRHEFVPGANPAYMTIELPIEVDDRSGLPGVFDGTDRILVFAQNWYERAHPSIAQRAWGDADVVFATYLSNRNGARLPVRQGWNDLPLTPLASYRTMQHYEKSGFYVNVFNLGVPPFSPAESDTNTDQILWTGFGLYDRNDPAFPDNYPFETNDLDNTRPVNVTLQWVGLKASPSFGGSATHIAYAEVKNAANQWTTVVDSLQWQGRRTVTPGATLPGTAFSNGKTNTLRIFGKTIGTTGNVLNAGLNWFEVSYARRYKALASRLACNSDSAVGAFQITATGFVTRNIRVWDVTDSLAPVRLSVADSLISSGPSPYTVRFQDSSPTGAMRRYMVFDIPYILPAAKMQTVTPHNLAGSGIQDDLIIAPELLSESATRLAAHRTAQNLPALYCPLEAVNDEFNGGRKSTYSIRRMLQYVYSAWGTRFVTLLGDGSEDPQNLLGSAGPDLVPVQKIAGPVGIGEGSVVVYESVVSDPWYVWCLDGGCSPDGPYLQDMFIGRLPVGTPEQAAGVVDKLIKYDDVQPDQTWRRKIMLSADDQFSTQSFFGGSPTGGPAYCYKVDEGAFMALSEQTRHLLESEGGYQDSDIEIFDLAQKLSSIATYVDPNYGTCRIDWHATQDWCHINVTPQLFQHLTDGRVWWNFEGHANPYVLTHEDLYKNFGTLDDVALFNNVDKPFLFSAFSCHPNAFGVVSENNYIGPSLGEDMVNLAGKGAIASWASSAYELLPFDYFNHITEHLARSLFTDPPRDPYLGQGGARVMLGESIALALARNAAMHSGWEADIGITYQLLGDPATRLSIGAPLSVVTANALPVSSGDPVRLRTPGDTLRLEADLVSNVRLASLALDRTLAGVTTTLPATDYTVTPAFSDSGAASSGGRRFHLTYRTSLTADNYTFTIRTSDRYNVAGSFDVVFQYQTVLRADGAPVGDRDPVSPIALTTMTVISPAPLTLPADLEVLVDSVAATYTYAAANGDTTGREWLLTIPHDAFGIGPHRIDTRTSAAGKTAHLFVVSSGVRLLSNAFAFPNPFDDQRGTYFSFQLVSPTVTEVQVRVYTVTGRLIYKDTISGAKSGYQQIPWNGLDAEGQPIANGLYLYRIIVSNGTSSDRYEGRLIKLRRPRRAADTSTSNAGP